MFENDVIEVNGKEIKADQVYPGFCCPGHDWTVVVVFPYTETVWGICDNPDCPQYDPVIGKDDYYRGVTHWEPESFWELVERMR